MKVAIALALGIIGCWAFGFGAAALGIPLWVPLLVAGTVFVTFVVITLAIGASTFRGF